MNSRRVSRKKAGCTFGLKKPSAIFTALSPAGTIGFTLFFIFRYFWSQIAFAFTGLELVSAMSAEVKDPCRTLPRAVFAAGALIAAMYIAGTVAVLVLVPAPDVSATAGVFHAITVGTIAVKIGFVGI